MFSSLTHKTAEENRLYFRREFQICYQPVISFQDSRLEGFEALLRWQPERRVLYPGEFMALLEDVGLIIPLGEWLLYETASQLSHWKEQFPFCHPQISINLSEKQLNSNLLLQSLANISASVKQGPKPLQFEIPVKYLLTDPKQYLDWVKDAYQQGIEICLDDVEPDPAILNLIGQYPVKSLKLTIPLTQSVTKDPQKQAELSHFIRAARNLGVETFAKGIETADQYCLMDNLGCHSGQGYLFDQPLKLTEVVTRLVIAERKAVMSLKSHLTAMHNLDKVMQRWLGTSIIARYWQATKPTSEWLNSWTPDQPPGLLSVQYRDDQINQQQQGDLHMWVNRFLHRCNDIVHNLPYLLNHSMLAKTDLHLLQVPEPESKRTGATFRPRMIA